MSFGLIWAALLLDIFPEVLPMIYLMAWKRCEPKLLTALVSELNYFNLSLSLLGLCFLFSQKMSCSKFTSDPFHNRSSFHFPFSEIGARPGVRSL